MHGLPPPPAAGPGEYPPPEPGRGPAFSMRARPDDKMEEAPGPGDYDVGGAVERGHTFTMQGRYPDQERPRSPGPGTGVGGRGARGPHSSIINHHAPWLSLPSPAPRQSSCNLPCPSSFNLTCLLLIIMQPHLPLIMQPHLPLINHHATSPAPRHATSPAPHHAPSTAPHHAP